MLVGRRGWAIYYVLLVCTGLWMGILLLPLITTPQHYAGPVGALLVLVFILILGFPFFVCVWFGVQLRRRPVQSSPLQQALAKPEARPRSPSPLSPPVVAGECEVVVVCPSCGAKNPAELHKCSECGANL